MGCCIKLLKKRNKFAFVLNNALQSFLRRNGRKINFIIMLSMAAGMLFPVIALANYHATMQDLHDMSIKQDESVYSIEVSSDISAEQIATATKADDYTAVYATQSNFSVGGKNFSAFVYGISENFGEYIPFHTITGSLSDIFDSVSPKAIVEVGFLSAKGLSGFSLPFTITIDGVEVEVVGTVKCPLYAQTIFVSTQTLRQFYNSSDAQLQKLLLKSPNTSSGLLQGNLKQLGIDATVTKATQVNESIRASSITNTSIALLLGFLSLVFSFIDIVEIVVGKLICNKKAIAIKLAIGASKKDIFYEVFLENILLGTVSTLVALFVAFLLLCALPLFTNVLLDFFVAAISWLVCLIVFLLITVVACMVVTRSNIVGMLHRE